MKFLLLATLAFAKPAFVLSDKGYGPVIFGNKLAEVFGPKLDAPEGNSRVRAFLKGEQKAIVANYKRIQSGFMKMTTENKFTASIKILRAYSYIAQIEALIKKGPGLANTYLSVIVAPTVD
jgi:predicted ArsR family transcriptional regulator